MLNKEIDFMNSRHRPARWTAEQVSWELGITLADVTTLMSEGHLVPIGAPRQSSVKHFHRYQVEQLARSRKWMDKLEKCLDAHWVHKRERKAELKALRLSDSPPDSGKGNQL